jgi:putative FmdB family regulatory protein
MPIYEYKRPDGSTFEVQQSFSDEPLTADPETGVPVQRVFHPPAVHFKGKGFYNTDYGKRSRQRDSSGESEGGAEEKPKAPAAEKKDSSEKPAAASKNGSAPAGGKEKGQAAGGNGSGKAPAAG